MSDVTEQLRSDARGAVRLDLPATEVAITPGEPAALTVEVTNLDGLIRSFELGALGLDDAWVEVPDGRLELFPGERRQLEVTVTLPEAVASGRQRIAFELTSPEAPDMTPVTAGLDLVLEARAAMTMTVEPTSLTVAKRGTFLVTLTNVGNTTLRPELTGQDPERKVEARFEPLRPRLLPGERAVVDLHIAGQRPWFGMPEVRILELDAVDGEAIAHLSTVVVQKPRISRRVLALLGLLAVVTLFAFVIMYAFGNVAARAEANEALLRQGLGEDQPVGVRTASSVVAGSVTSTTGGPIDGAAVELFDADDPLIPVRSTVTGTGGHFRFAALSAGDYLLRIDVAGFGELWYPDAETFTDAETLTVEDGGGLEDLAIVLAGRPGSVAGVVLGEDVVGATVAVRIAGDAVVDSELDPTPSDVASVEVDATGRFVLEELATPSSYELVVSKPGFATDVLTVTLGPGEQRSNVEVHLRVGDGRLSGEVLDTAGEPVAGVLIEATDGTTSVSTRSLSGDDTLGSFELRDLPTPAAYTITVSAEGWSAESLTVELDEAQHRDDLTIVMTSERGSVAGRVMDISGTGLGGVDITVDGAEIDRSTVSLSTGDVGSWLATELPAPGVYTVTFSHPGYATQAVSVELLAGAEADRAGIDVVLTPANATLRGRVVESGSGPIGGVAITLDSSSIERRTVSSHEPPGAYRFDDLPPGSYSITFARPGSRSQTVLVDVTAGQDRQLPDVRLEPQDRISGVVRVDEVGEAGISVGIFKVDEYPGNPTAQTTTVAGGEFEVIGLDAPQSYVLEFRSATSGNVIGSETVFLQPGEFLSVEVDL